MELQEAIKIIFNHLRHCECFEAAAIVESTLLKTTKIKEKVEACSNGDLTYANLLIWLKKNFS